MGGFPFDMRRSRPFGVRSMARFSVATVSAKRRSLRGLFQLLQQPKYDGTNAAALLPGVRLGNGVSGRRYRAIEIGRRDRRALRTREEAVLKVSR
jgi:hypothetical protein